MRSAEVGQGFVRRGRGRRRGRGERTGRGVLERLVDDVVGDDCRVNESQERLRETTEDVERKGMSARTV